MKKLVFIICFTFSTIIVLGYNNLLSKNLTQKNISVTFKKKPKNHIKVALLLDTSNSMDGLIDQAKAQLWQIINKLSYATCNNEQPNLEIALYEYGNDGLNKTQGYVRQILPFSKDLDDISKHLFSLTTNGGSEYCGAVIQSSLEDLNWGNNPLDLKLIFIAGNEPFNQGFVSYKDAAANAIEKDVTINTIFCGDYRHGINSLWKDGANLTQGKYLAINHNHETIHIATPYDDAILIWNKKLNETYIPYGKNGINKAKLQQEQDNNAYGYSKANAVSRTISKSSHLYKNSNWDLVDAIIENKLKINNLDKDFLPQNLQNKTKQELENFIIKQYKLRSEIQENIKNLSVKRQTYLNQDSTKNENPLKNAMLTAIKEQAIKKNYYLE